jgi:tetrapyrrole methylase family protein/MazG family protein
VLDELTDAGSKFRQLVWIMERLRSPDGCPWDRKQTFETIKGYLLEETYEVMEAIDHRDWPHLAEELGDLLLQPVFLAQMASEEGFFTISVALDEINQKLVRRHPHIFGDSKAATAEEVKERWDEIKKEEKSAKGLPHARPSILDHVTRSLPALVEASKISGIAARVGFEWPDIEGVLSKINEEATELAEARETRGFGEIEHETGDLLFTVVNLARFLNIDPEQALRKANLRFRERYSYIEDRIREQGKRLEDASLEELDALWQQSKQELSS